jgi:hypothetical protein
MRYKNTSPKGANTFHSRQFAALLAASDEPRPQNPKQAILSQPQSPTTFLEHIPEFRLLLENYHEGIEAALRYREVKAQWRGLAPDSRNEILEGLAWVVARDMIWPHSFERISEFLSLDPGVIRGKIYKRLYLTEPQIFHILRREGWACPENGVPYRIKKRTRRSK